MRILNTLFVALRALRRNKTQSLLTGLGIIIGVGAVIAMVSIGSGARWQIEQRVASLGRDLVIVFPGSFGSSGVRMGWGTRGSLKPDDVAAIRRELPLVAGVSPIARTSSQIVANGRNWNAQISGVSSDYTYIRSWPLAAGVNFGNGDVERRSKVALIGTTVMEQLGFQEPPLGQIIRIRNIPFKVLGVLARRGFSPEGRDEDNVVLVPYSSYLSRVDRNDRLNSILLAARDESALGAVEQQVDDLLRQRHKIGPGAPADFIVRNQAELADAAAATTDTMTALLGTIAGVSLVVGGIGIMNIMLVSVTERTREIGIRLAVGAHGRDVLVQFLAEAVLLCLVGAILGVAVGIGSSQVVAIVNDWPVVIPVEAIGAAIGFSAAVGIFFGYYPAHRAARLDPIEALRYE